MATDYYVDGSGGDDTTGDGLSEATAWATIQKGMTTGLKAVGDNLYIKNSVTYTAANSTSNSKAGTEADPITIEGYSTTPGDGGMVTIDGGGTTYQGLYSYNSYIVIKNITQQGFTGRIFAFNGSDYCRLENCHAIGSGSFGTYNWGFHFDNYTTYIDCTATDCTNGFYDDSDTRAINCSAINSKTYGFKTAGTTCHFIGCLAAGGATACFYTGNSPCFINCTADGEGSTTNYGIQCGGYYGGTIINCILHECGYGIRFNSGSRLINSFGANNMFSNCTNDYYTGNLNWPLRCRETDFTGDADFTDEANWDYTLDTTSDAIGAGMQLGLGTVDDKNDCGAYQTAMPTAGGGGQVVLTS